MRSIVVSSLLAVAIGAGASSIPQASAAEPSELLLLQAEPAGGRADIDVDVDRDGGRPWYLNPFWIGIAVVALLLIVVLSAVSRGGSGGTTIVKT